MAQKRMFSLAVVDTDKFLDMSSSAQALYFHLGMHGDDDGFVSSPKKIARTAGCNDDDLRLLAAKGFVIPFDSGVIVITDWNINNTLKMTAIMKPFIKRKRKKLAHCQVGNIFLVPAWFQSSSKMVPAWNLNIT